MDDYFKSAFDYFKHTWAAPFMGDLSYDQLKDIAYPQFELYSHVTQRSVMVMSVLGGCGALTVRFFQSGAAAKVRANRIAGVSAVSGLFIGPALAYARSSNFDEPAFYDRAFRLRNNEMQVKVDRYVTPLGILGAIVGRGAGLCWGVNLGLLGLAGEHFYTKYFNKETNTEEVERVNVTAVVSNNVKSDVSEKVPEVTDKVSPWLIWHPKESDSEASSDNSFNDNSCPICSKQRQKINPNCTCHCH